MLFSCTDAKMFEPELIEICIISPCLEWECLRLKMNVKLLIVSPNAAAGRILWRPPGFAILLKTPKLPYR